MENIINSFSVKGAEVVQKVLRITQILDLLYTPTLCMGLTSIEIKNEI